MQKNSCRIISPAGINFAFWFLLPKQFLGVVHIFAYLDAEGAALFAGAAVDALTGGVGQDLVMFPHGFRDAALDFGQV